MIVNDEFRNVLYVRWRKVESIRRLLEHTNDTNRRGDGNHVLESAIPTLRTALVEELRTLANDLESGRVLLAADCS